jgi:hypothetical protein
LREVNLRITLVELEGDPSDLIVDLVWHEELASPSVRHVLAADLRV